jgi:hypothetical protein
MIPRSDIVKEVSCSKAKAEAIVNGIFSPATIDDFLGILHRHMTEIEKEQKDLVPHFSVLIENVSALSADNANIKCGKHLSVFQNLNKAKI